VPNDHLLTTDPAEALEIGVEAYTYFYPLLTMDVTRRVTTNLPPGMKPGFGPMNAVHHMRAFPTADFRAVVRPNFDTLYSSCWIDVTSEPVILTAPDTGGRYYLLPLLDMWSDVIAVPGKRTSGTAAATFAIVPPGWQGALPEGAQRIQATTGYLWMIGRTQTNGPADYEAVHKVQEGYTITPLSRWGKPAADVPFTPDPNVDMQTDPMKQVNGLSAEAYFAYAASLLKVHPPHATDWSMLARMRRIGIEVGRDFDASALSAPVRQALQGVPTAALQAIQAGIPTAGRVVNGWTLMTECIGVYGDAYVKRAIVALVGLGANQPEDAIYPLCVADADGRPIDGSNDYVLHFDKAELPPVGAFWSVTMYDGEGFQVANPLNRFAIGDRDPLTYNADGSLDILISSKSPSADRQSNWLPAPAAPVGITMRLYAPKAAALDGRWNPPAIKRA
jgi:hypothetical protein